MSYLRSEHRRGFTLPALLASLCIVGFCLLILMPLLCQNQVRQEQNVCYQNIRRLGQATLMYAEDYDQTLPLSTSNIDGQWQSNQQHMVPDNWSWLTTHPAVKGSKFVWPNTILNYGITFDALKCPSQESFKPRNLARFNYEKAVAEPAPVGYTFNGLLNTYSQGQIVNPSKVPLIWEGRGRSGYLGGVLQNPILSCSDGTQPCVYSTKCSSSSNGGTGGMPGLDGPVWTHQRTNIWLFVDGHVEPRTLGVGDKNGNTDSNIDPYTGYSERGLPGYIYTNGCHPWLFRPDYTGN